jgi:hypothetical protein
VSRTEDLVVLERMPDQHRGSHRAAGNWGSYPHNGAERTVVTREWADQTVEEDEDGYDHIVRDATADDVSHYGRGDGAD